MKLSAKKMEKDSGVCLAKSKENQRLALEAVKKGQKVRRWPPLQLLLPCPATPPAAPPPPPLTCTTLLTLRCAGRGPHPRGHCHGQ
jgi:hypothetical protein